MEEAVALGKGMMEETRDGNAYLRWEINIVIGRRPEGSIDC
jgi:hypothetical protein